jgi:hypothetical protein
VSVDSISKLRFSVELLRSQKNTIRRCPRSFGEAGPCEGLIVLTLRTQSRMSGSPIYITTRISSALASALGALEVKMTTGGVFLGLRRLRRYWQLAGLGMPRACGSKVNMCAAYLPPTSTTIRPARILHPPVRMYSGYVSRNASIRCLCLHQAVGTILST